MDCTQSTAIVKSTAKRIATGDLLDLVNALENIGENPLRTMILNWLMGGNLNKIRSAVKGIRANLLTATDIKCGP